MWRGVAHIRWFAPLAQPAARAGFATPLLVSVRAASTALPTHLYTRAASRTLEHLQETMETFVDSNENDGSDVDFSGDVLTLTLEGRGTFVINKQSPNQQIWLSSPLSGPLRYDLDLNKKDWLCTRDGRSIGETLEKDISSLVGKPINFDVSQALEEVDLN
mmetsp:Transcript_4209/g.10845  ORF Transcript_4209/g.10845 Transcript_4209/m.10845 type:complete len:161 (-) Transcript_4209:98-580(-)